MSYTYSNLKTPKNTGSGIADYSLVAPVEDFDVDGIKCPEAPFVNPGDQVRILNPHVFKADKAFAKLALAPEKNSYSAKTIGDKGFQKFAQEVTAFVPGSYAEVHEAMKNYLNTPLIVLAKDSECGADIWYQVGCDCVPAYMSPDFGTGTTKDGQKGYEVKITSTSSSVLLYAAGEPAILGD